MSRAEEFRLKLQHLSDAELVRKQYVLGLCQRLDNELLALRVLFGPGDEPLQLSPPPDTKLSGLAHLFQQELLRRNLATQAKTRLHTEGENDRGNTNSNTH